VGVAADMRTSARAHELEHEKRWADAEALYVEVKAPPRVAADARGRRGALALGRRDFEAVVAAHEGHEPAALSDRINLGLALFFLQRVQASRAVLDAAVELADDVGEDGAISHAVGEGEAVLAVFRARQHATPKSSPHVRGLRARFALRTGDTGTARADLAKLAEDPFEHGILDAELRFARGDYHGSTRVFIATLVDIQGVIPQDARYDLASALIASGEEEQARLLLQKIEADDPVFRPGATKKLEELDARQPIPDDALLVDEGPSDALMTGGADGQGPRLFTGSRWVEGQETVYGFAPEIHIPASAAGRVLEVEVGSKEPLAIQIIAGHPESDDHSWWQEGFETVASEDARPNPKLRWQTRGGVFTVFIARVLPKGSELSPLRVESVKVRLRGTGTK
jgi:hypothetical protein